MLRTHDKRAYSRECDHSNTHERNREIEIDGIMNFEVSQIWRINKDENDPDSQTIVYVKILKHLDRGWQCACIIGDSNRVIDAGFIYDLEVQTFIDKNTLIEDPSELAKVLLRY